METGPTFHENSNVPIQVSSRNKLSIDQTSLTKWNHMMHQCFIVLLLHHHHDHDEPPIQHPNNIPHSNYTISPHNPKSEIMPVQLIPHRSTQDRLTRPLAPCHVRSSWTCLGWTLPMGPSGSMNDDKIHWELNKKLRTRSNIGLISTYLEAF